MPTYLERFDATPEAQRWALVRGWIFSEPLPFYAELRANRPILVMPELTLATSFADCTNILHRHDVFSVALYKPKQGDYWMAQDDTPDHWREKSVMKAILDFEDIPKIRAWIDQKAADLLAAAGGQIDAVAGLTRAVPLALTQEWFGYRHANPDSMREWSYWNQLDAFWNQAFDALLWPDPAAIVAQREKVSKEMAVYLVALVAAREAEAVAGIHPTDTVSRLVSLSRSGALTDFGVLKVVQNVGGLLIGAVETTSHCVVNVMDWLTRNPALLAKARAAAKSDDLTAIDGYAYEALRFMPAFPYFFRTAESDTSLGRETGHETPVAKGTTVLAVTHAAMFDPAALPHPDDFDPTRGLGNQFLFGYGLHECLGRAIAAVMIPAIVRQALRIDGLKTAPIDYKNGPIPESWQWTW